MRKIKEILSKKWLQHLIFWVLSLYTIGSYFSISGIIKIIDFIYAGFFHIPLMILVYINIRYLVPRFLQKEQYFPFLLLGIFNLGLAYFIHELLFEIMPFPDRFWNDTREFQEKMGAISYADFWKNFEQLQRLYVAERENRANPRAKKQVLNLKKTV